MNIKIYVATHKKVQKPTDSIFELIQVGSSLNADLGYLKDNDGCNISNKNKYYCELTALYWMWKNSNYDYVGLCHYRRFFCKKPIRFASKFKLMNGNDYRKILNKGYEIIVPREANLPVTVLNHYESNHYSKDLYMCREAIENLYPEYLNKFDEFVNQKKIRLFNMFVGKKEVMDNYFEWLFNVLSYVEERTNLDDYDDYQKRIYGFLSERLFNIWLNHNSQKYRIFETFTMNTEDGKVL